MHERRSESNLSGRLSSSSLSPSTEQTELLVSLIICGSPYASSVVPLPFTAHLVTEVSQCPPNRPSTPPSSLTPAVIPISRCAKSSCSRPTPFQDVRSASTAANLKMLIRGHAVLSQDRTLNSPVCRHDLNRLPLLKRHWLSVN